MSKGQGRKCRAQSRLGIWGWANWIEILRFWSHEAFSRTLKFFVCWHGTLGRGVFILGLEINFNITLVHSGSHLKGKLWPRWGHLKYCGRLVGRDFLGWGPVISSRGPCFFHHAPLYSMAGPDLLTLMKSKGLKSPEKVFTNLTRCSASARMLFLLGHAHLVDPSGNWKSMRNSSRVILGFVQLSQHCLPFLPPCNLQIRKSSLEDKKSHFQVCKNRPRTRLPF